MKSAVPAAFVVDASVSAAWFLPDEATDETEAAMVATASKDVWVPSLWTIEMTHLLAGAQRRKRITAAKRRELADRIASLRIRVDREAVGIVQLDELAERYALTAYAAVYLELALRRRLPMATRDEALRAAMATAGVVLCLSS